MLELNGNPTYEVAVNYGRHKLMLAEHIPWVHLEIIDNYNHLWHRLIECSRNAHHAYLDREDDEENEIYADAESLAVLERNRELILETLAKRGRVIWVAFDAGTEGAHLLHHLIFPFDEGQTWLEPLRNQVQRFI